MTLKLCACAECIGS